MGDIIVALIFAFLGGIVMCIIIASRDLDFDDTTRAILWLLLLCVIAIAVGMVGSGVSELNDKPRTIDHPALVDTLITRSGGQNDTSYTYHFKLPKK